MEGLVGVSWRKNGTRRNSRRGIKREIREELSVEIIVDEYFCTVDYDYPKFHLTMHCYICSLHTDAIHLNEHESARWLAKCGLDSVNWLPADKSIIEKLKTK